jgi:hypothetical protein
MVVECLELYQNLLNPLNAAQASDVFEMEWCCAEYWCVFLFDSSIEDAVSGICSNRKLSVRLHSALMYLNGLKSKIVFLKIAQDRPMYLRWNGVALNIGVFLFYLLFIRRDCV